MIDQFKIANFKSVRDETVKLGRINVFIGENGAGKSNILEALAVAGAAGAGKLDNEFLASRGIRVSAPRLMRSGFDANDKSQEISISLHGSDASSVEYTIGIDDKPFSSWDVAAKVVVGKSVKLHDFVRGFSEGISDLDDEEERTRLKESFMDQIAAQIADDIKANRANKSNKITINLQLETKVNPDRSSDYSVIENFLIFSPENSALRSYEREGQIEPLGINGEGLLRFLRVLGAQKDQKPVRIITENLKLFSWFNGFSRNEVIEDQRLGIIDRFLDQNFDAIDHRSANEGFLFVLFYLSLMASDFTPKFFAIDNVDFSLNPKLCTELMKRLCKLAKQNDKQIILTAHNPAIIDGLDLTDDDQRLFVVYRTRRGETKLKRILKPHSDKPTRLSEMFINGLIGGVPKGF